MKEIIDNIRFAKKEALTLLLENFTVDDFSYAKEKARKVTNEIFGERVYLRGLIEISNICKNDCYYCGIRRSNKNIVRYRMSENEILSCCKEGYEKGMRTFVLQGGEDGFFTDEILCSLIRKIKLLYPSCAVTLSLGERGEESYKRLKAAGADRYLLRHETADKGHYELLHPKEMSFDNRVRCLCSLKEAGYQTGCGMMIGSPGQGAENIAEDLLFIKKLKPEMVGMGPFIPQRDTPFANEKAGSVTLTLFLISLVRLMLPFSLIPATTALGALSKTGMTEGLHHGANVIMPNLTPGIYKEKYALYDNKANAGDNAGELNRIKYELKTAGYEIAVDRGDYPGE